MKIIADCSYEDARKYKGKLNIELEDGKTANVKLAVECASLEEYEEIKGNKAVEYLDCLFDLPEGYAVEKKTFRKYSLDDKDKIEASEVEGVIPLLKLPEDFADMYLLSEKSKEVEGLRLLGGKLLGIEDVRIGREDVEDKNKKLGIFYDGVYDLFQEVNLSELENLNEIVSKRSERLEKALTDKEFKAKNRKPKKAGKSGLSKKITAFEKLFSSDKEEVF